MFKGIITAVANALGLGEWLAKYFATRQDQQAGAAVQKAQDQDATIASLQRQNEAAAQSDTSAEATKAALRQPGQF